MSSLSFGALPIRLVKKFAVAASLLCRCILALMVIHIAIDIFMRYVLNISLPGTIAFVANYYMIAIIFLPLATAEIGRRHIEVEVVTQMCPAWVDALMRFVGWSVSILIFSLMTYESWREATRAYTNGLFIIEHGYRVPVWISYYMLPLGFASMTLICLTRFAIALLSLNNGVLGAVERAEAAFAEDKHNV
jgi:TRAP-type C4-dicarboxylate transport system permease small subunit